MLQKGKTKMDLDKISNKLEKELKPDRYRHTKGVMYTAAAMAMRYEQDIQEAMLAGLLHDCGKFTSSEEQVELCKKYKIELSEAELQVLPLIHAKLGAYLAKEKYKVDNERVINAILYHTTGRPNMTMLDKIIYLSDYIEPGRKMIPGLTEVRKEAFTDIDHAVSLCAKNTLEYLKWQKRPIDPMTAKTYEYYSK